MILYYIKNFQVRATLTRSVEHVPTRNSFNLDEPVNLQLREEALMERIAGLSESLGEGNKQAVRRGITYKKTCDL